jgi:hypothetical protein
LAIWRSEQISGSAATAATRCSGSIAPIASAKEDSRNLCSLISRSTFLQGFQNNLADVGTPPFECNPTLVKKFVALVDSRNA